MTQKIKRSSYIKKSLAKLKANDARIKLIFTYIFSNFLSNKTQINLEAFMYKQFFTFLLFLIISINANSTPEGYTKVKEMGGIEEYTLSSNGLTVLLMEDHSAPVLTFMVTYKVGSRNEVTGTTGATHVLEHLMFKGTEKYNKANGGHIDAKLGNIGALLNATTWLDRTNYYESIPSDYLELAIDIESDRMRNLLLRDEDRQAEMTVVRNEFERGENSPIQSLDKEIWAAAIIAHPYHHSTIGWRSDIENVPIEKLREFYDTFYWPNNATVTIIGDFEKDNALELVKKYYGKISSSPHEIPQVYTTEPEQQGPRKVTLNRSGQIGVVGVAHKVPAGASDETFSLLVLEKILSEGKSSRLYKSLVDKNKAVNIFLSYMPFKDESLFISYALLAPGTTHEDVENILISEYEKIKIEGVTKEEVDRAINQIFASTAYNRDGSFSIASELNESIAMGDWTFFVRKLENIKKVTPEDVQNIVKKYFVENKSTTGYFVPTIAGSDDNASASPQRTEGKLFYRTPNEKSLVETIGNLESSPSQLLNEEIKITKNIERENVAGIDVVTAKTGVNDVITFRGSLAAGDFFSPKNNAMIADITGAMLDKGTKSKNKFQLAEELENLGASLRFSVSTHTLDFNGKCLTKDLDNVISLLAEQLREPAFDQEEFEKVINQKLGGLKQSLEEPNVRANETLSDLLFDESHPNHGVSVQKAIDDLGKLSLEDVKDFYAKYYGPKSMMLVAVGDLEHSSFRNSISSAFKGWNGGIEIPDYNKANLKTAGITKIVKLEDKTSATLQIGQITGLKKTDKDYLPLMVANQIFGGGSFTARLMSIIRDEEGLTYGIYASVTEDTYTDGVWYITGTFSPDLLAQGYSSTMRELNRWVKDGVTSEEFEAVKSRLIGSYKVRLATTNGMASQILSFIQRGYSLDYLDNYPKLIDEVSLEDVNSSIKKYINPEKVVTVVAGTVTEENLKSK